MMDYKKAYYSLIERLKEAKEDADVCDERYCCVIDGLIQESEESERIGKDIVSFLRSKNGYMTPNEDWDFHNRWLPWLEKQGINPKEETPVIKKCREHKFEKGDFIVNNNSRDVYQVTEIRDDEYCLWPLDAEIMGYLSIIDVDNEYHLWYIEDAKDGDVLTAHECYVIFKETDGLNIKCYCTYHYMGFNPNFYVNTLQNKTAFQPATKEQKDFLFKRMEEEGYKWDDEHKELKKIETIDMPFSAKDSELMEATYFIPKGFHAEIVDNKVIIKKGEQKPTQEIEPFEAEHGKYYYCIKDYFCGGRKQASKGDVVQALRGLPIMGLKDASEYFLPVNFIKCNSAAFVEKACNAYCKVCGHFAHSVPTHICRHDCRYFSDFKNYMKGD